MYQEQLETLGLNPNEAVLYLALLKLKKAQAGKISKETQMNRTTVYDTLERLIEKGLVTYVLNGKNKVFSPAPPTMLLSQLNEKQKQAEQLVPRLKILYEEKQEPDETVIFQGRKGIRSILESILTCTSYVAFGSSGKFLELMKHDFILFQKQKKKLGIRSRVIQKESSRNSEVRKVAYAKFRYIPDAFASMVTTIVYAGHVAIIVWSSTPVATVIKSSQVFQSYMNYFELLWQQAKP